MATFSVGGLTGFDFGSLADALIELQREPINLLQSQKQKIEGRKYLYNEVVSQLNSLKSAAKALAEPAGMSFVKATSSDEELLTASASSQAALGSYQVTVHRLATASRVSSGFGSQLGISAKAVVSQHLNATAANLGGGFTGGYITINGTQVAVNVNDQNPTDPATNDTLQEVINRINSTVAGVTASYEAATDQLKLKANSAIVVGSPDDTSNLLRKTALTTSAETFEGPKHVRLSRALGRVSAAADMATTTFGTALTGSGSFTINGVQITYDAATESLNEIISKINSKVSTVAASYDQATDRIVLSSKQTGSLGTSRADNSGNFLRAMGLLDSGGDSQATVNIGANAMISIAGHNDDQPIYSNSNTVTDAVPGLTLTLKEADPLKPVTVSTTRDGSNLKTRIQSFVSAYNGALQLISDRLKEEPLENATSATTQRVGLLRGDSLLGSVRTSLTNAVTNVLEGFAADFNRLGNLGVTIDKNNVKGGTLAFDETVFNAIVDKDFEQAYDVLFQDLDDDGKLDEGEKGVMPRLLSAIDKIADSTVKSMGGHSSPVGDLPRRNATFDSQIRTIDARIDDLERRLELREASLRARFVAAEQAISRLQASSGGSLLGSG
ncbi:MAG: flagellar filament capping protein FliD [Armatimonadetes bacterium]|nr:flagellar filament capping protein FliD [Armatimonadota bacterium]